MAEPAVPTARPVPQFQQQPVAPPPRAVPTQFDPWAFQHHQQQQQQHHQQQPQTFHAPPVTQRPAPVQLEQAPRAPVAKLPPPPPPQEEVTSDYSDATDDEFLTSDPADEFSEYEDITAGTLHLTHAPKDGATFFPHRKSFHLTRTQMTGCSIRHSQTTSWKI